MAQRKGQTGNPDGRPKGTPNKATTDLKIWVQAFIENNIEVLEQNFEQLEPKDKWQVLVKLLAFVIPRYTDIPSIEEMQRMKNIQESIDKINELF